MRLMKRAAKNIFAAALLLLFLLPVVSAANMDINTDLPDLERLIRKVNNNQTTPEKLSQFEDKLLEFFYDASPSDIKKLLAEFTPGDSLTILVFMKYSGKGFKEVSEMRRTGMGWDKMSEALDVSLERVIKYIKKFRTLAC